MKKLIILSVVLIASALIVSIIKHFIYPRNPLAVSVSYDVNTHRLFLLITNQMDHERVFDDYTSLNSTFDWRVCSGRIVISEGTRGTNSDSLMILDHFPTPFLAHQGRQIDLAEYFPQLESVLTNSNADLFLWYWCVWDNMPRKWVQYSGECRLK